MRCFFIPKPFRTDSNYVQPSEQKEEGVNPPPFFCGIAALQYYDIII